jgi:UDP-N-acetylglucosamine diphosphorylase / glucose-1-phosphate thymidylyltransferase / UDP-N-acetylgalactosamine diphosphorylase / glucosamine-1-phosphate N-acetyltransferase / galactosamine-1-phosphate N-acetyltransferase
MGVATFACWDDAAARRFEPFALTRPVSELRAGALLVRERWAKVLSAEPVGFVGAPHLVEFEEPGAPGALSHVVAGTVLVHARFAPLLAKAPAADAWTHDGRVVAVRVSRDLDAAALGAASASLDALVPDGAVRAALDGWWLTAPWDIVRYLPAMLAADIPVLAKAWKAKALGGAAVRGDHKVFVEEGAEVEPYVLLDAHAGPILIRRGAVVQAFTRLVGPAVVGVDSTVFGDRIASVSIGERCKVHGEVSSTVFIGHANKAHDGFVGHSVLGRWVNLGAGTTTSNLKNTYGSVQCWTPDGVVDTGLQFLGTLFGDHVKTGIGLQLTTGSVLGAGANVFDAMPPRVVPPFAWGSQTPYDVFALEKFVSVAERMMARRNVPLSPRARKWLEAAHAARWQA